MSNLRYGRRRGLALLALALCASPAAALLFSGAAAAGTIPSTCPAAASIRSAAGESLTRVDSAMKHGTGLCVYTGRRSSTLTFELVSLKGVNSTMFGAILKAAEAKDSATKIKSVSGLGADAVEFVENHGKAQPDGNPEVVITAYRDSTEIVVASDLPSASVVKVTRQLLR